MSRKNPPSHEQNGGFFYSFGKRGNQTKMAPAEFESALNILKGYCFTVKLWNHIIHTPSIPDEIKMSRTI